MKRTRKFILFILLASSSWLTFAQNAPDQHNNTGLVEISTQGQQLAGIKTTVLQRRRLPIFITAPGEVIPNLNESAIVTPRIQAQVVKRLVQVGEHVKQGQPLVRLSSVAVASTQAALLLSAKEWQRLKEFGLKKITAKRYHAAQIDYQKAFAKLLAYGMTRQQIKNFIKQGDASKADGEFTLLAPRSGTILESKFSEGQMVELGKVLYRIVNERLLWIDARVSNIDTSSIRKNTPVIIKTNQTQLRGRVLQVHHQLEASTRTQIIRIEASNPKDTIHPGQFVTCLIQIGETKPVLALPKEALFRTGDGDTVVYIETKPNHYQSIVVKKINTIGAWVIVSGIQSGVKVVTKGAFFIHAERLKGQFKKHDH